MFLDYLALGMLLFVLLVLVYGVIWIHDIPYRIAKRRDHPHQDAIHMGGWISLFTLHAIWPFLWIWAYMYRPGIGYGTGEETKPAEDAAALRQTIDALQARVAALEGLVEREARP